ncbi:MAG TPA: methylglyoxal synthase [Caldilineaceae bacterium]|nr:methylglyoxal synthase [Caldilineaceae bacterium]
MSTIALIAHDGKKDDMVRFLRDHIDLLTSFQLIATGTTGERIQQATGLPVERMLSGPYGGDAQIAARVAEGGVVGVIFMVDPLYAHPHEPDIQGLLRICNVYNVPLATNEASARFILMGLAAPSTVDVF